MVCWKHKWEVKHIDTTIVGNWHTGWRNRDDYLDYFIEFVECKNCGKRDIWTSIPNPERVGTAIHALLVWQKRGEPTQAATAI